MIDIEITELENEGNITVVAKGHLKPKDFIDAYMAYSSNENEDERPSGSEVQHVYMRKTPRDGFYSWWSICNKGKGAFPATIVGPM